MKSRRVYLSLILMLQVLGACPVTGQAVDSFLNLDIVVSAEVARAIQSKNLESSPVFYENGIVFVYAREKARILDPGIGMPYFELMYSDLGPDGQPRRAVSFSSNIRSRFHEGPADFTPDFQQIFFTRSNVRNGQEIIDEEKKIRLKIFSAEKGPDDWVNIQPLPFCADHFSVCHPAVSVDGSRIVFSSDMPGGFGGMDLYVVDRVDGIWQEPVNLGPGINTKKNEIFPTYLPNGVLFFSSDGHQGRGGLDLFATHLGTGTEPAGFLNLPAPFNSRADDLGLVIDDSGMMGFLASARNGKKFKDDIFLLKMSSSIFRFPESKKLRVPDVAMEKTIGVLPDTTLAGTTPDMPCDTASFRVRTMDGLEPLDGALVAITTDCTENTMEYLSSPDGMVDACLPENCRVFVHVSARGYKDRSFDFRTESGLPPVWNISLEPEKEQILEMDRLETGVTIVLDNIYYDFNKSAIQRGAAEELEELSRIMNAYPSMRIRLTAHTDSRGTGAYNLELSERRAFAARDFLVARGIEPSRIETLAKGEAEIRNRCRDGVPCSETEHRFNRRTEVQVLHIDAPVEFQYGKGNQR